MASDEKQPFMSHLEELRKRLVWCAVAVGVGFAVAYVFSERLFEILISPLKDAMKEGDKLVFTALPEMFFAYLKIAFVAGLLGAAPVIFHQLWLFVAPGLYQKEKKLVIPFVVTSTILFVGGALFGYLIVFPFGFRFFLGLATESVTALPSVREYIGLSMKLLLAFGIIFELPVVLFFLTKTGLVTPKALRKQRKYAILSSFIVGAVLTPPDVISQLMMSVPLVALYEVGILVSLLAVKKEPAPEEPEAETPPS